MTIEFVNPDIQDEYDDLKMQEDFLLGDLEKVQGRIQDIEDQQERL